MRKIELKRYDLVFDIDGSDEGYVMKIASKKSFVKIAKIAEKLIGTSPEGARLIGLHKIVRYSDVEVI